MLLVLLLSVPQLSMLESDTEMIHQRWGAYSRLNEAFAAVALPITAQTDLVLIHDHHLMLLPALMRARQPKVKIGWFLHTPFPSAEIYVTLPLRKELLRGVLAADLIAFHTFDYVRHFMNSCSRVLGTDITVESNYILDSAKRTVVTVDAFPTGIDFEAFQAMLSSAQLKDKVIELQRRFDGKSIVLGIDRMDYVKGIPHKLIALEKFLHAYPAWASRIMLVQIATPPKKDTARYQKLRNKVHKLVGRINGRFGTLEHAPIHYLDQPLNFCELVALYFLADVCLISSLREGMSKVAFEFIACQQRNKGVLILSEFIGAAQTLGSGAILVNPYHTDALAKAIYEALHMPEEERIERHTNMSEYVSKFTIQHWAENFVLELQEQEQEHELLTLAHPTALPLLEKDGVVDTYRTASKRLIILGLLGTLIAFDAFRELRPIDDAVWKDLLALASDPRNTVVIISGRERALVSQFVGDLPVWIAAENGIYYRLGGRSTEWQSDVTDQFDDDWMASITPVFRYFEERTPGSVTETLEHSITWHYQEADEDFGEIQASVLQEHLEKVLGNQPVEVSLDAKQVQVRPYAVSKGAILDPLIEACTDYSRAKGAEQSEERDSNTLADPTAAGGTGQGVALPAETPAETPTTAAIRTLGDAKERTLSCPPGSAAGGLSLSTRLSTPGVSTEPSEFGAPGLDYILCVGQFNFRDEDIFGNLVAHKDENSKDASDDVPYAVHLPETIWTVRVGEAASQAKHFVEDEREVHALLATLSNVSQTMPPPEGLPGGSSVYGDDGAPSLRGDGPEAEPVASALDHLAAIEGLASGMQLAFFLDYDGTLTPIVDNPNAAILSEEARSVVRGLAARYPTAIVSGRARATAQGLVQLDELYYAGSHGFDITGPMRKAGGRKSSMGGDTLAAAGDEDEGVAMPSLSYQVADSFRPALEEAKARIEEAVAGISGCMVEDNTFSVSVHYRMVSEGEDRERVQEIVDAMVAEMPMLRRTEGKMVYELRPSADWDKGKAVEWLLEQIRKEQDGEVFPFYIGDDVTDEDAFRIMGGLGGIGIIVSDTAVEDSTAASYALHSPKEVVQFLDHFAQGYSSPSMSRSRTSPPA